MHTLYVLLYVYPLVGLACFVVLFLINMMTLGGIIFRAPGKAFLFCVFLWPVGILMLLAAMSEDEFDEEPDHSQGWT